MKTLFCWLLSQWWVPFIGKPGWNSPRLKLCSLGFNLPHIPFKTSLDDKSAIVEVMDKNTLLKLFVIFAFKCKVNFKYLTLGIHNYNHCSTSYNSKVTIFFWMSTYFWHNCLHNAVLIFAFAAIHLPIMLWNQNHKR